MTMQSLCVQPQIDPSGAASARVSLRSITAATVRRITNLTVAPHQRHLVASNAESLAEAPFYPQAWHRGIFAGEEPVGFVMLYDEHLVPNPPDQPRVVLWRFMIDQAHQGLGLGGQALSMVVSHVKASYPALAHLELSYVPGPSSPAGFYRRMGFLDTDRLDDGEQVMELLLKPLKADHCPLCSQPNACAASACGSFDVDCWCRRTAFDESVLARIPPESRGRACVCERCAQGA